jgi:hypothetical protein
VGIICFLAVTLQNLEKFFEYLIVIIVNAEDPIGKTKIVPERIGAFHKNVIYCSSR